MPLETIEQLLISFNNKLGNVTPKSVKTCLSLISKYKDKLTKHRKNRILRVLNKTIHELVEMNHSNDEHFEREGLDDLVDSLVRQGEEFENRDISSKLPENLINQVMMKVQDINRIGNAFSFIEVNRLNHILREGLLGTNEYGAKSDINKQKWYNNVRKKTSRKGRVYFNIIGRSTGDENRDPLFGVRKVEEYIEYLEGIVFTGRRDKVAISFNIQNFKENPLSDYSMDLMELVSYKQKVRTYRLYDSDPEYGFVLSFRVAPRDFMGIIFLKRDSYGEEETNQTILQNYADQLVLIMLQTYRGKGKLLIPIYDIHGNLWWPRRMSYKEVKAYVNSR